MASESGLKLRDALLSRTRSLCGSLSQLVTRPNPPAAPATPKPVPEGRCWGKLVLLNRVGEGSFGEVYRAWDIALEREVALKLMHEANGDPAPLQEARMLARLRHRNVVTVYGADRHDRRSGLWMDFIEGGTLSAIVEKQGPFGEREALLIGADVCRALAAVHRARLLHRDIKAQNVMRERGGRIVLMDFGLGHETTATAAGTFGGTPLYMAPELFQEQPASVRSDVYAVGVLLYYLVTGAHPVEGATLEELQAAHANRKHQLLRDLRPDLPSSFVSVVEKAIDVEPSRRYATAGQMTAALEAALNASRFPMSRRTFWVTVSSTGTLGSVLAWFLWPKSPEVKAGATLLLTEISNTTGDVQLNAVGEVLRVQLAQSAHFNLLERDRVRETLVRMTRPPDQKLDVPVAREVGLRSATPLVVYGTVSPLGAGYGLSVVMERIEGQPRTPVVTESKLFEARNKNGLFDAIHQAATWIRRTAGEAVKDISTNDTQPEEATTSSWEALDYFSRGERIEDAQHLMEALAMYQRAVQIDPGFAMALARVAQGNNELRRTAEAFEYWRRAVDALPDRHVTRREELRIRSMRANLTEDYTTAEELTHTWALLYPNDSLAHHYRALALRNLGRLVEARDELLTSQRLRTVDSTVVNLIQVDLLLGRSQEVSARLKDLSLASARYYGGLAKFVTGDFVEAKAAFDSVQPAIDARLGSLAEGARASLIAELGQRQEAIQALEAGIAHDAAAARGVSKARKLLALAHLRWLSGERDTARALSLQAIREDTDTLSVLRAGTILTHAGYAEEARALLARMNSPNEGRRRDTAHAILASEISTAFGSSEEALAAAAKADKLAPPIHPRQFLARALSRAGHVEDSLAAWRRIADSPALVWAAPDAYDPGAWTEALLHVGELAVKVGRKQEALVALDRFLKTREHADSDDPQFVAARKLLESL